MRITHQLDLIQSNIDRLVKLGKGEPGQLRVISEQVARLRELDILRALDDFGQSRYDVGYADCETDMTEE